jgi:hypothetical protein
MDVPVRKDAVTSPTPTGSSQQSVGVFSSPQREASTRTNTHTFNDPKDPSKGGTWFDDHGRRLCIWYWDAAQKTVTVVRGTHGKRIDLSGIGDELLTPEELRKRFPKLAFRTAQRITDGAEESASLSKKTSTAR